MPRAAFPAAPRTDRPPRWRAGRRGRGGDLGGEVGGLDLGLGQIAAPGGGENARAGRGRQLAVDIDVALGREEDGAGELQLGGDRGVHRL